VISTEGAVTEPAYFDHFSNDNIQIKILTHKTKNAPSDVLKRMMKYLEKEGSREGDQHWLVIDKDEWKHEQIKPLHDWAGEASNRGLALSNPHFEYWLLLHFEKPKNGISSQYIFKQLKKYLPGYDKSLSLRELQKLKAHVHDAMRNARQKDSPKCKDWPRGHGATVYRLVEVLIKTVRLENS
jgi:hypothetical protein